MPLRGPTATDLADRYDDVQRWASGWRRRPRKTACGWNSIPSADARSVSTSCPAASGSTEREQALTVLGLQREAAAYLELVRAERERAPKLVDWMLANPHRVLEAAAGSGQACFDRAVDRRPWR